MSFWHLTWDTLMAVLALLVAFIGLSCFFAGLTFLYDAHEWLLNKVAQFWRERK